MKLECRAGRGLCNQTRQCVPISLGTIFEKNFHFVRIQIIKFTYIGQKKKTAMRGREASSEGLKVKQTNVNHGDVKTSILLSLIFFLLVERIKQNSLAETKVLHDSVYNALACAVRGNVCPNRQLKFQLIEALKIDSATCVQKEPKTIEKSFFFSKFQGRIPVLIPRFEYICRILCFRPFCVFRCPLKYTMCGSKTK